MIILFIELSECQKLVECSSDKQKSTESLITEARRLSYSSDSTYESISIYQKSSEPSLDYEIVRDIHLSGTTNTEQMVVSQVNSKNHAELIYIRSNGCLCMSYLD